MIDSTKLELDEDYYLKLKNGKIEKQKFIGGFVLRNDDEIAEVLGKVPSYEEWQAKLEENKRLKHDVGNLGYKIKNQRHEIDNRLKEVDKLKGLLKECREVIKNVDTYYGNYDSTNGYLVITKIAQVLGEE